MQKERISRPPVSCSGDLQAVNARFRMVARAIYITEKAVTEQVRLTFRMHQSTWIRSANTKIQMAIE